MHAYCLHAMRDADAGCTAHLEAHVGSRSRHDCKPQLGRLGGLQWQGWQQQEQKLVLARAVQAVCDLGKLKGILVGGFVDHLQQQAACNTAHWKVALVLAFSACVPQ